MLGTQLALLHQLMHGPEVFAVVAPDTGMQETQLKMDEKGSRIAHVVENGRLICVIWTAICAATVIT